LDKKFLEVEVSLRAVLSSEVATRKTSREFIQVSNRFIATWHTYPSWLVRGLESPLPFCHGGSFLQDKL